MGVWDVTKVGYFMWKRRTFSNQVTQCPHLSLLSCYSERCDAVGVGRVDGSPSSYQYLTDLCVVPGYGLVEGGPALTTPLVHGGPISQSEAHHVHVLQLTGCRGEQDTGSVLISWLTFF